MANEREIFVCAGEASGDLYAAQVVRALRAMHPELSFWGAGGVALEEAGVVLRHRAEDLAVTGISELRKVAWAAGRLLLDSRHQLRRRRPALALLVDYPGANLRLAKMAKDAGVPVLYYVAPQRWAWLSWRLRGLRDDVDHLAAILPFEEPFFTSRGVKTTFVGHPLLDLHSEVDSVQVRRELSPDNRPVLTLWPGSRPNELEAHLPRLASAAHRLKREFQLLWVTTAPWAAQRCQQAFEGARCVRPKDALALGRAVSSQVVALCCSGTATLQLALAGVPLAVFYRMGAISALAARALLRVPYVALPNLILGREVVPELLQERMTVHGLEGAAHTLMRPDVGARQRASFAEVRETLGGPGAGKRVAALALELLER
ncbi:MAG: lipid-A-disaccharide synthase [Deltaproteobacteria bacterium]|nr:lipid-A-disaccharide synthase [Deltaproteobacteria bacterium]